VSNEERNTMIGENEYLRDLINSSGLEILKKTLVQRAYEDRNEKGLFHLFLNQSCLEGIRVWTNAKLLRKGKKKVSKETFNAYIGLELAMSIVHLNDMHDYWSTKKFLRNDDMKQIMSQDRFTEIRSSQKFYPECDQCCVQLIYEFCG
jgi:Transposase IS4